MSTQFSVPGSAATISIYCAGHDRGIRAQLDGFDGMMRGLDELVAMRLLLSRAIAHYKKSDREYLRARFDGIPIEQEVPP